MSGPLPAKTKKKKRTQDDQPNLKRLKFNASGNGTKNPMPFENTLSLPIQEALYKFREASEQELIRLRKEGMDPSTAINKLVEKMRTIEEGDAPPCFSRQELELVMEMAGINEEGATRALILRSELAKLRHDGFNHPEAINELSRRMKRLAGSKRRISLSMAEGVLSEAKHRRKEAFGTLNLSRVSFTQFDSTLGDNLSVHPLEAPISRKRLQDTLMLDDEQLAFRKRPKLFDKDISDSDGDSEAELYHFEDVGEFSQDEDKEGVKEEDDSDDVFDASVAYASSDEDSSYTKDTIAEGELLGIMGGGRGIRFHAVKEEGSDSDDAWQFAAPTIRAAATPPYTTTTTTTTTAATISTSTSTSTSTSSFTTPTNNATTTRTQAHIAPKTKRRDSTLNKNSLSQNTVS